MAGRDVRHASVISSGLIVSDSVGVASLIRYCSSIGGAVSFTRLGCVLSNIEGGDIFFRHLANKSVGSMISLGVVVASGGWFVSLWLVRGVVGLLLSLRGSW